MPRTCLAIALAVTTAACGPAVGGGPAGTYTPPATTQDTISSGADTSSAGEDTGPVAADAWSGWKPAPTPNSDLDAPKTTGEVDAKLQMSELFKEAALECANTIVEQEKDLVAKCPHSAAHVGVLGAGVGWAIQQVQQNPLLAGLDWLPFLAVAPQFVPNGKQIAIYTCASDPSGPAKLNAFAMQDAVWMLDPLLYAFAESAAWWDAMRDKHGTPLPDEGKKEVGQGIAAIFLYANEGKHGQVVAWPEVNARLQNSSFAWQVYAGASSMVLFHEIGHANLSHGLIQCAIRGGIVKLLNKRGIQPTEQQIQDLKAELGKIGRSTEAQADIYAFSMMKSLGFGKEGPIVFLLGMTGVTAAGCKQQGVADADLQECALNAFDPVTTSHPPLGERAALMQKIFDQGEDLTPLLQPANLTQVRSKECGNGTCEATESAATCPGDCQPAGPTCGNGSCEPGETPAGCAQDCKPAHFCDDACGKPGQGCFCDETCAEYGDCCDAMGTGKAGATCDGSTCGLCNGT